MYYFATQVAGEVDWPVVLLLQLSHDVDTAVRSSAARGLATVDEYEIVSLQQLIRGRVQELAESDGIGSVSAVLHGFARNKGRQEAWWRAIVGDVAESHPSSNTRSQAGNLLSELG